MNTTRHLSSTNLPKEYLSRSVLEHLQKCRTESVLQNDMTSIPEIWWNSALEIYTKFCKTYNLSPQQCDPQLSEITKAGIMLSDGQQFHTFIDFKHRWVRTGIVPVTRFEEFGLIGIERPSAKVIWAESST